VKFSHCNILIWKHFVDNGTLSTIFIDHCQIFRSIQEHRFK
jgi:hypothetical protein